MGTLELDINFLLRKPLWPPVLMDSHPIGSLRAKDVTLLDVHELAAGKLAALFDRNAARDLFDACYPVREVQLERNDFALSWLSMAGQVVEIGEPYRSMISH